MVTDVTDKQYKKQQDRIKRLCDRWLAPLGLRWWRIEFAYARDGKMDVGEKSDGASCAAKTWTRWEYREAVITFNVPEIMGMDDERVEYVFVHELMHIFLNEMRQFGDQNGIMHEEHVASTMGAAFIWLRNHCKRNKKNGRK